MNTNSKWFHFASAGAVTLFGVLATMDWSSVMSAPTAGKIVIFLGVAKMAVSAFTSPAS